MRFKLTYGDQSIEFDAKAPETDQDLSDILLEMAIMAAAKKTPYDPDKDL